MPALCCEIINFLTLVHINVTLLVGSFLALLVTLLFQRIKKESKGMFFIDFDEFIHLIHNIYICLNTLGESIISYEVMSNCILNYLAEMKNGRSLKVYAFCHMGVEEKQMIYNSSHNKTMLSL